MTSPNEIRNQHIAERRRYGETLDSIGRDYGMSRERVRQLCKRHGAFPSAATRKTKKAKQLEDQERRCWEKWGLSLSEYRQLRAMHSDWQKTPIGKYVNQRNSAKGRGIEWHMTLGEWWRIWENSGVYDQRGSYADDYCMTRLFDEGPYSPDNVRIQRCRDNSNEYWHESLPMQRRRNIDALTNRNIFTNPHSQWDMAE